MGGAVNAQRIIGELRGLGVELQPAGPRLRFRPAERVPAELMAELRAHKPEVLRLLKSGRVQDGLGGVGPETLLGGDVCAMQLSEFAGAGKVVEVRSAVLGETVVFASDNAILDPGERRPVYRAAELRELAGLSPEDLRQIHRVKRTFQGTILGGTASSSRVGRE